MGSTHKYLSNCAIVIPCSWGLLDGDGDGASLGGGVDGDSGDGMEKTSGSDSDGVSPSDLLRRRPSVSLFLVSLVWRLSS